MGAHDEDDGGVADYVKSEYRDSSARSNFTMIPNMVIEMPGVTHTAFRLYTYIKRICGEVVGGTCYQSLTRMCEACQMSRPTLIASRRSLVEAGLLKVDESKQPDGSIQVVISVVDIWRKNDSFYLRRGVGKKSYQPGKESLLAPVKKATPNKSTFNKSAQSPNGDGACGGFAGKVGGTLTAEEQWAAKAASALASGLADKVTCKPDLKLWASQFLQYIKPRWDTRDRIRSVLIDFVKNFRKSRYIPKARSAKTFCERFDAIEDALVRFAEDAAVKRGDRDSGDSDEVAAQLALYDHNTRLEEEES